MKVVTWNCNGALRNKFEKLEKLDADIYIIQECEDPNKTMNKKYINWAKNSLWIGDNKNKGLGIFAKEKIKISHLNWSHKYMEHDVKYFLPFSIDNKSNILALWNHKNHSPNFGYIGQLWKYLQVNKHKMSNTIVIGDFNSNTIWDEWDRWWNHSDVVRELNEIGIDSVYHQVSKEKQGEETSPTFFLYRNIEKSYHIDYVFVPKHIMNNLVKFEIGSIDEWLKLSDHLPIICEFKVE
ncbi:MAG: hypothetical protein PHP27_07380 [Bacteroidales bacterium]|jgi:exonuclease III|nr:hypothetical protein [Bacteroidales bacterium]MDX9799462.1 hypothetical protein [Bacteroidales bacterium]